jgi:uncharacterized protein YraI
MSHTRANFVAVTLVVLSAACAAAEPAVVGDTKLNLRSGPGPAFGIVAVLAPGTKLQTQKCTDEWCRVKLGRMVGYTSRAHLKIGADSYASAAPEAAPDVEAKPVKPTLTGPRISRWRDSEWRDKHWRQFGWRNRLKQKHH